MALHSSSYDSMYQHQESKPPTRGKGNGVFAVMLVLAAALIAVVIVPGWRSRVSNFFSSVPKSKVQMNAKVWADKRTGGYYCADSRSFGRGTGVVLRQGEALTLGYQPVLGKYCADSYSTGSTEVKRAREKSSRSSSPDSNSLSSGSSAARR